jgi:hypothetical protein
VFLHSPLTLCVGEVNNNNSYSNINNKNKTEYKEMLNLLINNNKVSIYI